jgi:hypothetical protein
MGLNEPMGSVRQSTAADLPRGINKLASNRQPSQRGREYSHDQKGEYFHHSPYVSV